MEDHGRNITLTRNIYRLLTSDVYHVQSERSSKIYYYVKYNPDIFEWCSCLDNNTRHVKCKYIFGVKYAIMKGTLKYIERLPGVCESISIEFNL